MSSKHLSSSQIRALEKLGDLMIPGNGILPRFSQNGRVSQIDRILDYMPQSDLTDLATLLKILSFFPGFVLRWILWLLELSPKVPGPPGALLRMIRLGIRGLVMTLYYSDPEILDSIGYEVKVYTGDLQKKH